jgi:hypothetical protein
MDTEKERRQIQARIDVARDLIDRVEIVLCVEWKDDQHGNLLPYAFRALETAGTELEDAVLRVAQLNAAIEKAENNGARPE